jgi:hypothetical protein
VDVTKKIVYGSHADEKFEILRRHGLVVSKRQVRETLRRPEKVEEGFRGRKIAHGEFPRSMFCELSMRKGRGRSGS